MNLKHLQYAVFLLIVASVTVQAQGPEGHRWWDGQIAKDLELTPEQSSRIRDTVRASRPQLIQLRASVQVAEAELRDEMAADPVDRGRAGEAIDRVVKARGELMQAVSRMSLDLRMVLTASQWQELERRRPRGTGLARPARRQPGVARPDAGVLPENQ
jgi:Spy/CpxP family protein refolding chaperone